LPASKLENIHPLEKRLQEKKDIWNRRKNNIKHTLSMPSLVTSATSSTEVSVYLYFSLPNVANFI
jgi:hypothetical protein